MEKLQLVVTYAINLSLCFNWARHEGVLGEWRYSSTYSLTLALDRGEWSASHPSCFTPRERAPDTHWIGGCFTFNSIWHNEKMLPRIENSLKKFCSWWEGGHCEIIKAYALNKNNGHAKLATTLKYRVTVKMSLCLTKYHDIKMDPLLNYEPHYEDIQGTQKDH
jgi:hypothetical protein